jgi:hypothetical protein
MDVDEIEKKMQERGIDVDSLEDVVDLLSAFIKLQQKYNKDYIKKLLDFTLEIIAELQKEE